MSLEIRLEIIMTILIIVGNHSDAAIKEEEPERLPMYFL
jgi:hypothetical protein